jgi:hypothetical protein
MNFDIVQDNKIKSNIMSEFFIITPITKILIGKSTNAIYYEPILGKGLFIDSFNKTMCNFISNLEWKQTQEKFTEKIAFVCEGENVVLDIYCPGNSWGGTVYIVYQRTNMGHRILFLSTKHHFYGHGHSPADESEIYRLDKMKEGLKELNIDANNHLLKWHL